MDDGQLSPMTLDDLFQLCYEADWTGVNIVLFDDEFITIQMKPLTNRTLFGEVIPKDLTTIKSTIKRWRKLFKETDKKVQELGYPGYFAIGFGDKSERWCQHLGLSLYNVINLGTLRLAMFERKIGC